MSLLVSCIGSRVVTHLSSLATYLNNNVRTSTLKGGGGDVCLMKLQSQGKQEGNEEKVKKG
jgi:hypothetical protein